MIAPPLQAPSRRPRGSHMGPRGSWSSPGFPCMAKDKDKKAGAAAARAATGEARLSTTAAQDRHRH
eukprot:137593-Lingulodinium_polyedra.AAC.1